jgi:hypothetical protein
VASLFVTPRPRRSPDDASHRRDRSRSDGKRDDARRLCAAFSERRSIAAVPINISLVWRGGSGSRIRQPTGSRPMQIAGTSTIRNGSDDESCHVERRRA